MLTRDELLKKMDEELRMGRGLDGVLSVAIDELLKPVTVDERAFIANACYSKALLDSRRLKLERVKTPAEQIADLIVARFGTGTLPAQKLAAEIIELLPKNQ